MNTQKPSVAAMRAARALRMKIHSMRPGKELIDADHPTNAKWLDSVVPLDALLIDVEFAPLVEAAEIARSFLIAEGYSVELHCPELLSALARIKGD